MIDGHGLTWTDGPRVEGYSNLLWILLVAGLGSLGVDPLIGARIWGITLSAAAVAAAVIAMRPRRPRDAVAACAAGLSIAVAVPVAAWSVGELEQPLVGCLLAWAVLPLFAAGDEPGQGAGLRWLSAICLGLLCLARPDGALFAFGFAAAMIAYGGWKGPALRWSLSVGLAALMAIAGQSAFRLAYYGDWLPNSARVKLIVSQRHTSTGLEYIHDGFDALLPLSLIAVVGIVVGMLDARSRRRTAVIAAMMILWSGYLAVIGGDIFQAWRHFVPLIVLAAFLIGQLAQLIVQRWREPGAPAVVGLFLMLALAAAVLQQPRNHRNVWAREWEAEWEGQAVGRMLAEGFADEQPLLAVDAAGSVPYWSCLPCIDMLGINDRYIAHYPPAGIGKGFVGHELGDGDYVLSRSPDLVLFRNPRGRPDGIFLSGRQMQARPEFHQRYTLADFEAVSQRVANVRTRIWINRDSERIGIRRTADSIAVPAYFFNGRPEAYAFLDAEKRFVVGVSPGAPAEICDLPIPPGQWRAEIATVGDAILVIRASGDETVLARGAPPLRFELTGTTDTPIDVEIRCAGHAPIRFYELRLTKR